MGLELFLSFPREKPSLTRDREKDRERKREREVQPEKSTVAGCGGRALLENGLHHHAGQS
jgi:hypothetical protein